MKKVVVIGGGFLGSCVARQLQSQFNVVLIDNKEYFEFTPGVLRVLVEPEHLEKIQVKHKNYLKRARFVKGQVSEVAPEYVRVNGKKAGFNYLVIASGSSYSAPIKHQNAIMADRGISLQRYASRLEKANRITVVGGGVGGVELAAEICTKYRDKEITIIHAGDSLIERNHPGSIRCARKFLQRYNVKIIYGERAIKQTNKEIVTDKRRKIKTDLVFLCTGITPNDKFMKKNYSHSIINRGIEIDPFLRVIGAENIFAGGDVCAIREEKTAQAAEIHAEIIAQNIINTKRGRKLIPYISRKRPMIISLGKFNGIFEYKNFVISGLIPAFMKWAVERKTMWKYR